MALSHVKSGHAVVVGTGMAGLLAGRVLLDHFKHVTLIEKDLKPHSPEVRKSAPQGHHIHGLFAGGAKVIAEFFPGFFDELVHAGSVVVDVARDACWYHYGMWKKRTETGLPTYVQSRPFLEWHLRKRLTQYPGLNILYNTRVSKLIHDAKQTVTGVEIHRREPHNYVKTLKTDLVIDASGRGSRITTWLKELNYPQPQESKVTVNVGYASRLYQIPNDPQRDWKMMAVLSRPPSSTKMGAISPTENKTWLVTLMGCHRDYPEGQSDGFLSFAKQLDAPDLYLAIKDATPASDIHTYRFPYYRRRYFERLRRWPKGLLVIGDAVANFSPIYGQGMSVAALQAKALAQSLKTSKASLAPRYFTSIAKTINIAWALATGSDFLYPQTKGKRPFANSLRQWYSLKLLELSSCDEATYELFMEVMHLIRSPTAILHPHVVTQVIKRSLGFTGKASPLLQRPSLSKKTSPRNPIPASAKDNPFQTLH